tara:strand:+ start:1791 stop:1952 length:162 start_codon:yes stop_codon:yes gene_type:complete
MKKKVLHFYEHDNKIVKDFFSPYKLYILFPPIKDEQVVTVRLIPCIKKDPKVI